MTDAVRPVSPSSDEIKQLLTIAERDIGQARIDGLHLATAVLRLHGIRVRKTGFHQQTFAELKTRLPAEMRNVAEHFDRARRKRNAAAYDRVNVVSERDVDDLIEQVDAFQAWVDAEVHQRGRGTREA